MKYYFNKLKMNGFIKRVESNQNGHWELLVEEQEDENTGLSIQIAKTNIKISNITVELLY